eukprot:1970536-Pleurochrysis_carterae.AAC.1
MRLTRFYSPTLLYTRRIYVWAPSKLVTKPIVISATVDGRLDRLRGKTVATSHFVTFTCPWHVMHVCRYHSCVGLYGSVINSFSTASLRVRTRIVCPRYTEPLKPRLRALVS